MVRTVPTRILNLLRWIARGLFVVTNNFYCIPTYCVWMYILSPIRVFSEELFWRIEGQFFYWLLTMVAFWSYSAGYNIVETGDDINPIINEECMVLVNHQSTSDVPILMAAFSIRNHLLQNLSWIMDGVFKYTNFGVVSVLHGDFFIEAGPDKRNATNILLKDYLKKVYASRSRKWIVLFPEGGFLRKRREAGHRYAKRLNLPLLNYVTLPRLGAIQAIMDTIGPNSILDNTGLRIDGTKITPGKLKYVIDMTIAYPGGNPLDIGSVVFGYDEACDVRMHYRVFPIAQVPSEPDQLQDWTYKRYIEKEALLEYYYRTGIWEPRVLDLDPARSNNLAQEHEVVPGESDQLLHFNSAADIRNSGETASESSSSPNFESDRGPMNSPTASGEDLYMKELCNGSTTIRHRTSTMVFAERNVLPSTGSDNAGIPSASAISGLSNSVSNETRHSMESTVVENQTESESKVSVASKSAESFRAKVIKGFSVGSQETENGEENRLEEQAGGRPIRPMTETESKILNLRTSPGADRRNQQDLVRIGLVHVGFILSTAFHVYGGIRLFDFFQNTVFAKPPV